MPEGRRAAPDATLDALDRELLELLALRVPWYMVCGEFHARYGSPGVLAMRLFEMRDAGLVDVRGKPGAEVSAAALERDALEHDCYEVYEESHEPQWDMVATDRGFALVEANLGRQ